MYDVCWIRSSTGLMPVGPIYDTMIAASVIDENRQRYFRCFQEIILMKRNISMI